MNRTGSVLCLVAAVCAVAATPAAAQQTVVAGRLAWLHLSTTHGDLPPADVGRQVAALIADLDNDGVNDFVIASYERIVWYRRSRDKAAWTRYRLEKGMPTGSLEAGGDFRDLDGDGDLDLVMGAGYGGKGEIWWWENPYPAFDPEKPWKRYQACQIGSQHHDQLFGDFNADGKTELAFFNNRDGRLFLAQPGADPKQPWQLGEIAALGTKGGNPEGLATDDINADRKPDLVGGGWWFERQASGKFKPHPVNPKRQFSRCVVGDLVRGCRPEIVLGSGDGVGPLEMYRYNGTEWVAKTLIPHTDHGHTLQIGDIDGDGQLDLLAGEMHTPGPGDRCKTYLLFGDGKGNFRVEVLATGIGCHESKLGDLDGDGRLDILHKDFQKDQRVDLWLNRGPARAGSGIGSQ